MGTLSLPQKKFVILFSLYALRHSVSFHFYALSLSNIFIPKITSLENLDARQMGLRLRT